MIIEEDNGSILKYIAPYDVPENNNQKLLSSLKINGNYRTSISSSPIVKIPVLLEEDLTEQIQANNARISDANNENFSSHKIADSLERKIKGIDNDENTANQTNTVQKFVDIKVFLPQNLRQQVTTVVLKPFANLKTFVIESILRTLIPSGDFEWSIINLDVVDSTLVFIRFFTVKRLCWFTGNYKNNIKDILGNPNLEMIIDANAQKYLNEVPYDELNELAKSQIKHDVDKMLSVLKQTEKNISAKELKDIDEALSYYSNYKVDYNELIDVPSHLKDTIIKDIVKFRSKVLMIEKQNRKNELEAEHRKTRQKLMQTIEGIKEVGDGMQVDENSETDNASAKVEEFEELSDEQYEKYLDDKLKKESLDKYELKLNEQKKKERTEKHSLMKSLEKAKSYEDHLIENKFKYLEDFSAMTEMNHIFYTNHSEYVTKRNKRKLREFTQDMEDAKVEQEETPQPQLKKREPAINVEVSETANTDVGDMDTISEKLLSEVRVKIEELIEEYLGVKEYFIIDLIYDFIKDNGTKNKDNLVQELAEPLDEDSASLVNDLWAYMSKLKR